MYALLSIYLWWRRLRILSLTISIHEFWIQDEQIITKWRTVLQAKGPPNFILDFCVWLCDAFNLHGLLCPVYRTAKIHTRSGKGCVFQLIHETPLCTDGEGWRTLLVWDNKTVPGVIVWECESGHRRWWSNVIGRWDWLLRANDQRLGLW